MYKTSIGPFNGDSWESLIQICLKYRYKDETYRRMDATVHGDLGIEGYTLTGKVFQCYCPDNNMLATDLTEKQKIKINNDLAKLKKYESEIKKHLLDQKINKWILITPEYMNKDIHVYCNDKTIQWRNEGLSILDDNFSISVHELEDYAAELPIAMNHLQLKLELRSTNSLSYGDVVKWRESEIEYIDNANRKYNTLLPKNRINREIAVEKLTDKCVEFYLYGNDILRQWQQRVPEKYESFVNLINTYERELQHDYLLLDMEPNQYFNKIKSNISEALNNEFSDLSTSTIKDISSQVVSKWILECYMDFE